MKWLPGLVLTTVLAGCWFALAAGPDDQYIEVFRLIKQADGLEESNQHRAAYEQYQKARAELRSLKTNMPSWNPGIVDYRLSYIAEKLTAIETKAPEVKTPIPQPVAVTLPSGPELQSYQQEIQTLRAEVQRLSEDRNLLESKLREALRAQPAAVDPRAVERAEDKVREVQKENEVLKATVEQQKTRLEQSANTAGAEETRKALAEANRKLGEQEKLIATLQENLRAAPSLTGREKVEALEKENEFLKSQIAEVRANGGNPAKIEELTRQLGQARADLEAQKTVNESLRKEQKAMEKQLAEAQKSAKTSAATVADLEKEKADLEERLTKRLKSSPADSKEDIDRINRLLADKEKLEKQLSEARATAKQSDQALEDLKKEKAALQSKLEEDNRELAKARQADLKRMERLEKDRADLQKKLDSLTKATPKPGSRAERKLMEELDSVRAKLEAMEAKKVPFTPEELALFKEPATGLNLVAAGDSKETPAKPAAKPLSAESGMLVAEAQRAFNAKRYDEAERKYQEVLKQNEGNVSSLYNLAVIQMEQNRLDEAEVNLRKAISEAGDDGRNWSLLGILKFREKKYDDAFEALSRSVKLDPNNPETQNYLGITLSEKGQRVPAEAALRKAIQLSPNYSSAHHNLAIIYATQKPPFLELARWHYQKATSSGHPRNPELEKLLGISEAGDAAK